MKMKKAKVTFRELSVGNQVLRLGIGSSLCLNLLFGYWAMTRPETVVLVPPYTHEEIRFTEGRANAEYYKQWSWSVAMLVGNLDPSNTEFVKYELQRMATTGLYAQLESTLTDELREIVRDRVTITFTPVEVIYDPELDLHFVTGEQIVTGVGTRDLKRTKITYEMKFKTDRLRIRLTELRVYPGDAMTAENRRQRLEQQEAQAKQEES